MSKGKKMAIPLRPKLLQKKLFTKLIEDEADSFCNHYKNPSAFSAEPRLENNHKNITQIIVSGTYFVIISTRMDLKSLSIAKNHGPKPSQDLSLINFVLFFCYWRVLAGLAELDPIFIGSLAWMPHRASAYSDGILSPRQTSMLTPNIAVSR